MMSTAPLSVREVANEAEMTAFLCLPWTVYKDDPCWVAPLWADHVAFFDPAKNPELRHIDLACFVAWRGDQPVGTIIAHENHAYNESQGDKVGWFGQFEVLEDAEAAAALLEKAESWVRARGLPTIRGPATFSVNSEIGLLIDGFDIPPKILMRHDRPYYRRFIEDAGYVKAMDLWAYHFDGENWGATSTCATSTPKSSASRLSTTRPGSGTGHSCRSPRRRLTRWPRTSSRLLIPTSSSSSK
jgi:hypothetical protein